MPELPEVEFYRRLAERTVGRCIATVAAPDAWFVKGNVAAAELPGLLVGRTVAATRRIGKLLLLDLEDGDLEDGDLEDGDSGELVLGLRFGMTGRLLVDGVSGVEQLLYSSARDEPRWDRFGVGFADGGQLVMRDPRRLGGVSVNPNTSQLGPDALTVTRTQLATALRGAAPVKACLLDQKRVAGIGNLLADEVLWRAGISPERSAETLSVRAIGGLHRTLGTTVSELIERGGSHMGELQPHRRAGGHCPRDGVALRHGTIGGRSTWWCPVHQR